MAITDQQWLDHANQNVQEFSNRQIMLKGTVSPPGALPAPIGAFYKNQANGDRYEKTGTGDTDWELFATGGTPGDHNHRDLIEVRPCDASLVVGDLVWESVATPGNVEEVVNNTDNRRVVGICISKPTFTTAEILFSGRVSGLTGLTIGRKVYCSSGGVITGVLPTTGYIQVLGDAISLTEVDFSPSHQRILRS